MELHLYRIGETAPMLTMENVVNYTADYAVTEDGTVYGPFAGDCELSSTADCAEMLRADWWEENPSEQSRMEELEALVAGILFGGEGA